MEDIRTDAEGNYQIIWETCVGTALGHNLLCQGSIMGSADAGVMGGVAHRLAVGASRRDPCTVGAVVPSAPAGLGPKFILGQ
jgi:hypothetical protein